MNLTGYQLMCRPMCFVFGIAHLFRRKSTWFFWEHLRVFFWENLRAPYNWWLKQGNYPSTFSFNWSVVPPRLLSQLQLEIAMLCSGHLDSYWQYVENPLINSGNNHMATFGAGVSGWQWYISRAVYPSYHWSLLSLGKSTTFLQIIHLQ